MPEGSELDRAVDALRSAVEQVNEIIREHNRITVRFEDEARSAYLKLERHYLALARAEYQELINAHAETAKNLALLELHQRDTRSEVEEVEREIQKHQKPAEELNRELSAYLGRDELRFAVKENGYTLNRGGKPVNDLSEGERTAIAFLYFLKTLQDESFDMSSGVIVVDDPVSSLDANALFSAFSYLKERVGDCGQLFVLTHNFAFFRRVRDWFLSTQKGPKKRRRSAGFYQLRAGIGADGVRSSALTELDPLLKTYDSEYHYLFKRVYDGATEGPGGSELEHYYSLPNVARCLIESFLGFRYPDGPRDNLTKLIERVSDFDAERRTRVCRFLHARSHGPVAMDPEHDPTALAEARAVLKDVLELMKTADRDHYDRMVNLVAPEPAPAASGTRELDQPGAAAL